MPTLQVLGAWSKVLQKGCGGRVLTAEASREREGWPEAPLTHSV